MHRALVVIGAVTLSAAMLAVAHVGASVQQADDRQAALDPFYAAPAQLPRTPGTVIRSEPLGVDVPGAHAYRVLYATQRPDGTPAVTGGMVFIPTAPAPAGGRPIVAWAHGTVGMGDACAPSRSANPLGDTANWLDQMLRFGWIVTATDYAGLGTTPPNLYLVAQAEVRDVVNSVRAARSLAGPQAGSRYVVWGHSQGGHSALWSGHLAPTLAPELTLLGVAAAAPAAELNLIMGAQWDGVVGWAIGPEIVQSWPHVAPQLPLAGVVTQQGIDSAAGIAQQCTSSTALALQLLARTELGQTFFAHNPAQDPAWLAFGSSQIPAALPASMPVFIGQSTSDTVVLPWPNAVLQQRWCAAGSRIDVAWVGEVSHQLTAETIGPQAVSWIADRFAGRPAPRTCDVPPPVQAPAGAQ